MKLLFSFMFLALAIGCAKLAAPKTSAQKYNDAADSAKIEYVDVDLTSKLTLGKWFCRDGDGTTSYTIGIAYSYLNYDTPEQFVDKLNKSSIANQTNWSEYRKMKPNGRNFDDLTSFEDPDKGFAGTNCSGLVSRSLKAGGFKVTPTLGMALWTAPGGPLTLVGTTGLKKGYVVFFFRDDGTGPDPEWVHTGIVYVPNTASNYSTVVHCCGPSSF